MNELQALAERINRMESDHVFTLHPDVSITEPRDVWAPAVYSDDIIDIYVEDDEWSPLTGLTNQDSYDGAVMHPSEYIGRGIAEYMQELAAEEPVTFVVVVVEDLDDTEHPTGWAILMKKETT